VHRVLFWPHRPLARSPRTASSLPCRGSVNPASRAGNFRSSGSFADTLTSLRGEGASQPPRCVAETPRTPRSGGRGQGTGTGEPLQGFRNDPDGKGVAAPTATLMGVVPASGASTGLRSRYSVRGTRLAVSTASRSSEDPLSGAEAPEAPMALDPLQGIPRHPRRSPARLQRPSWGFAPLQRLQRGGPQFPGFQPRFVPPSGFPTLLTGSSLRAFRPRGPVPLMGFTLQSLSPPRSRTPFSAVALLLFLATRSPALRTRRSRCPAAPGLCSPRGSVPGPAEAGPSRCSLGLRASPERSPATVGTASRPLPSCAFDARSRREMAPGAPGPCRTTE
jgi:hypothetical protein